MQFGGGGYASVGDPITGPRETYENAFAAGESLTWIHGRHELKFGGDYRRDQINVVNGIASNGFFVFIPAPLTNAFANFLIGQPYCFCKAAATSRTEGVTSREGCGATTLTSMPRIPTRSILN